MQPRHKATKRKTIVENLKKEEDDIHENLYTMPKNLFKN